MNNRRSLDHDVVSRLTRQIRGEVLQPGIDGYDPAREIWNSRLDRRPSLIVRCVNADDVIAAVESARTLGIPLAVRGGGHDYAGNSTGEGALLIDLSPMNEVSIDPDGRTARVQAGATWGEVDRHAQAFGLGTTAATVSSVGVAGYLLGGGTGHLARAFGLGVDNLLSADLVTAAGRLVRASENENPDLFWGIRGGGGNFGVATEFELALHSVGPEVLAGQIVYPFEDAPKVVRVYRDVMADAPDQLNCYAFVIRVPPIPAFAEEHHGKVAIDLVVVFNGPVESGERLVAPLRTIAAPILDWVEPQQWTAVQQTFDAGVPGGLRWYTRSNCLMALSDSAIDTFLEWAEPMPGTHSMAYLEPFGGAIARVDPAATAFPHRHAPYSFHVLAGWDNPQDDDRLMGWARSLQQAMAQYSTGGAYVNLVAEDEADGILAAYGPNYDRLVSLKRVWDPGNLFRLNHNIQPTG